MDSDAAAQSQSKIAWHSSDVASFLRAPKQPIVDRLARRSAEQFIGDQRAAITSYARTMELLSRALPAAIASNDCASNWGLCFEFPLTRLCKRIDAVLLAGSTILVLEFKTGLQSAGNARQAEDYALDLRDFHEGSVGRRILPVLCGSSWGEYHGSLPSDRDVLLAATVDGMGLEQLLIQVAESTREEAQLSLSSWLASKYQPVPSIVDAARALFADHDVSDVADAGASNLGETSDRLAQIASAVRSRNAKAICFITGVPGAGKTLVGLNAVHDRRFGRTEGVLGAFLSGNTPLVEVLREALARDRSRRESVALSRTRREVRTQIQGLMGFLRHYLDDFPDHEPAEHFVIFDEAQRAWDAAYGAQKFNRSMSEPDLFLEIMGRRSDWSLIVALVGSGQEIGRGERGLTDWSEALSRTAADPTAATWEVYAPPGALAQDVPEWQRLFASSPYQGPLTVDPTLTLTVGIRSHRCTAIGSWVDLLLEGQLAEASQIASAGRFNVHLTRDIGTLRNWLTRQGRGHRRAGLLASSGAKRLRAEGLGVSLSATDLEPVKRWYLDPPNDIRSSHALEVTANEYTCQGLELDYVGLCWDLDLIWQKGWLARRLSGATWHRMKGDYLRYTLNKYRVLLTRARAGTVIWVPRGSATDSTRDPSLYDEVAEALVGAGAISIDH